jgi:hypothetical protein
MEVDLRRLLRQAAAGPDRQRTALTGDDEQAILRTVRAALGPDGLIAAGTGVLRTSSELEDTLDRSLVPDHRSEFSIKRERVLRADETSATVDLDATFETITTETGARTRTKVQGPVQLVREGDAWKVEDLVVDGISLRSSIFENGVTGSVDGFGVRVLGGRVFPSYVRAYIELSNELERPVKVERVVLGQRRSLLPGWRWAAGRIAVAEVLPGSLRVDAVASLQHAHAAVPFRLLLGTDAGFVDARPQGVRRSRRRVPVSVRYPWAWGTAVVAGIVVALGLLFNWWIAGIVLVQAAGVTLLSFEGHVRRGMSRRTLVRFGWTLAALVAGVVLFFANGGIGRFRGESERERVTRYVELYAGAHVVDAARIDERRAGGCDYRIWDVRTTKGRYWALAAKGRHTGLPVAVYAHSTVASAAKLISDRVKANRQVEAEMVKMLGERARKLPPFC